jgi:hypothetical protein
MFMAQHEFGGGLDFSGFVAVHSSDRVRPRPGVAAVVVLEPADTLRCAAQKSTIDRPDGLSVRAGPGIGGEVTAGHWPVGCSELVEHNRKINDHVSGASSMSSNRQLASSGESGHALLAQHAGCPGSPCDECVNATSSHRRHTHMPQPADRKPRCLDPTKSRSPP